MSDRIKSARRAALETGRDAPDDPPLPSLARQAAGFLGTAAAVAAGGFKRATPEELERRMAICKICDHFRASDQKCGKASGCGCRMPRKSAWLAARCPIDRW